ncbi:MAG: putative permease [Thermomicrobiales bacterium]|nr:putative permease [Thermomicrobiales bacterium]
MFVAKERLNQAGAALERILNQYRVVLGERNVAILLGAGVISEIGDWFNTVAIISLAYGFGDGALGVGGMFAVRMLMRLIFQGPAGTFVDRYAGRKLLFTSQLVMAVIASSFVLLVVVPALWLLYLLVVLLEVANCIAHPAFMVELRAEAPEEQRSAANGVLFASGTTAQLVGPVLGALVLAPFGAGAVFALNGLTFFGVAVAVAKLRGGLHARTRVENGQDDTNPPVSGTLEPSVRGYAWLLRRQDLSLYMFVCLSLTLLVQATITLFVDRAVTLELGDGGVGLFYSAVAAGAVSGSIVAGARPQFAASLYPTAIAMGLCSIALAVFGLAHGVLISLVALVIAGFATDFYEVAGLTYFQNAIPGPVYARFYSVFLLALSAGALIGALAGPALELILGAGMTLVVLAVPSLALALLLAAMSRNWQAAERGRVS